MPTAHLAYEAFEFIVPMEAVREIFRQNDYGYLLSEHKRMLSLCMQHGYAEHPDTASHFVTGYILYIQKKYNLKTPLHPVSFRGGYRLIRKLH